MWRSRLVNSKDSILKDFDRIITAAIFAHVVITSFFVCGCCLRNVKNVQSIYVQSKYARYSTILSFEMSSYSNPVWPGKSHAGYVQNPFHDHSICGQSRAWYGRNQASSGQMGASTPDWSKNSKTLRKGNLISESIRRPFSATAEQAPATLYRQQPELKYTLRN